MRLFLVKDTLIDISNITGSYQRSENSDGLGEEFSFSLALNNKDKYWPKLNIDAGDKVVFENDSVLIFTGMIINIQGTDNKIYSVKAYDYGFLINKSQVNVQFRKMSANAAISKLCSDFGIEVGSICSMPTLINKVYSGDTVADCFKDIISQASADSGESYRMEIRFGKLYIEKESDLIITAVYKPASNLASFDVTTEPASLQTSRSIEDMRNSVKIIASGENSTSVISEASDSGSIAKYGLLQLVESVSDDNGTSNKAENRLAELNKIKNEITLRLMGDDNVRAGRILVFAQPDEGLEGQFKVTNVTHSYSNNNHYMDLTLEEC